MLPSEKLKKWLHRYVSLQALDREDLQHIYWEIQDNEQELERLRVLVKKLEKKITDMGWTISPDRMGG